MTICLAPHIDNVFFSAEISFIPIQYRWTERIGVGERGRLISIVIDRVSIDFAAYVKRGDCESFLFVSEFFFNKWMNNESQFFIQPASARHSHSIDEEKNPALVMDCLLIEEYSKSLGMSRFPIR